MRNLLMAGTAAGLFLALGAVNAYAVQQNSPYATMVPPGAVDGYSTDDGYYYGDRVEGRSAYVDPDYGYSDDGYADNGYVTQYPAPVVGGFYFGGGRGGHFHHRHFWRQ